MSAGGSTLWLRRGRLTRWMLSRRMPGAVRPRRIPPVRDRSRFLRKVADAFIHEANGRARGTPGVRTITALESTGSGMADRLSGQGCAYRLLVRGIEAGATIDTSLTVTSIERAIDARAHRWGLVLDAAVSPRLRTVISNATEAGYALDGGGDDPATSCHSRRSCSPCSSRVHAPTWLGWWILPCELVERNGDRLRDLVLEQAARRGRNPGH